MIANDITESPRLLFLGAGASKPLGKMLMGEFVQHLSLQIHREPYAELVRAISRKDRDLEFLMEQLEEISTKEYLGLVERHLRGMGNLTRFRRSVVKSGVLRQSQVVRFSGCDAKSIITTGVWKRTQT